MKLTVSTLACPKWTLEQIVSAVASAGIEGIDFRGIGDEIDITRLPAFNERLPATLELLKKHKLQMPCINTSVTLVTPDPAKWQAYLDEAQRSAQLARKTCTRLLRIFGGNIPDSLTRDEAAILARRHLRQLVKICQPNGCIPILETHDAWSTSPQVLELLHEFDPNETGALWDIEHPYRKGEPLTDTFAALKRFLKHVHVKDSVRVNEKNSPRLLGEGQLPLKEAHRILHEGGYDGWICLETEKRWHAEAPEPQVSIPQFAEFMRSLP